ncbi:hypothetical protein [Microbacterium hydrocarbonoxydans]|uniref:hypothetical protein n=1 Tax=Microbacterium hydrocarbonoxydans TaxID=273678 RepID=UPI0007BC3AD2|nr:hypothetical protein [Microbacterium hydrocarbonoxydans]GAT73132.1 secreted protein [Microbacterium sp. HM58-2]
MKSIKKRLVAGLGAALLAASLTVAVPATANAATYSSSCKGSHVATKAIKNSAGTVLARVGVYRDGNYMCAVLVKAGPVYGVPTYTDLMVSTPQDYGFDQGYFSYKTDAIRVYAPNHRVLLNASVTGKNGNTNNLYTYVNG